jgi:hypothetical protein
LITTLPRIQTSGSIATKNAAHMTMRAIWLRIARPLERPWKPAGVAPRGAASSVVSMVVIR